MDNNKFLKLIPEESKPAHLESDFLPTATKTANEQSPTQTLRRKDSFSDLKSKANDDGAGNKFLKLTPDSPKKVESSGQKALGKEDK